MKRSKVLALFGVMVLATAAYAGWCGRTFYLKPRDFGGDVAGIPKDVMAVVREWNATQKAFGPTPFEWSYFLWLLQHPYESEPELIQMIMNGGFHIIGHPGAGRYPEVTEVAVEEDAVNGHRIVITHKTRGSLSAAEFERGLLNSRWSQTKATRRLLRAAERPPDPEPARPRAGACRSRRSRSHRRTARRRGAGHHWCG